MFNIRDDKGSGRVLRRMRCLTSDSQAQLRSRWVSENLPVGAIEACHAGRVESNQPVTEECETDTNTEFACR